MPPTRVSANIFLIIEATKFVYKKALRDLITIENICGY